jgi:putative membrane protein
MRMTLIYTALVMLAVSSCETKKNEDPKNVAEQHNNAKFSQMNELQEAQFMVNAAEFDLQQICLFKLAQENSIIPKTQTAGKILEKEYTELYSVLKDRGIKKQITVPSEMSTPKKKICTALSYEIAEDFEEKFYILVIKDHRDAIESNERSLLNINDPDLITFINKRTANIKKNLIYILLNYEAPKKQPVF